MYTEIAPLNVQRYEDRVMLTRLTRLRNSFSVYIAATDTHGVKFDRYKAKVNTTNREHVRLSVDHNGSRFGIITVSGAYFGLHIADTDYIITDNGEYIHNMAGALTYARRFARTVTNSRINTNLLKAADLHVEVCEFALDYTQILVND